MRFGIRIQHISARVCSALLAHRFAPLLSAQSGHVAAAADCVAQRRADRDAATTRDERAALHGVRLALALLAQLCVCALDASPAPRIALVVAQLRSQLAAVRHSSSSSSSSTSMLHGARQRVVVPDWRCTTTAVGTPATDDASPPFVSLCRKVVDSLQRAPPTERSVMSDVVVELVVAFLSLPWPTPRLMFERFSM